MYWCSSWIICRNIAIYNIMTCMRDAHGHIGVLLVPFRCALHLAFDDCATSSAHRVDHKDAVRCAVLSKVALLKVELSLLGLSPQL